MNNKLDFIFKRRSIRQFTQEPVSDSDIHMLMEAAMAAPSGHNYQPWHFVVIRNRERLDKLAEVHNYAKMLFEAPLCIAVCGEPIAYGDENPLWNQDCAAATQNILLAATALGLGSVWLGIYPKTNAMDKVSAILQVPARVLPFSLIALGVPKKAKEPRTQYDESKVHFEEWA